MKKHVPSCSIIVVLVVFCNHVVDSKVLVLLPCSFILFLKQLWIWFWRTKTKKYLKADKFGDITYLMIHIIPRYLRM